MKKLKKEIEEKDYNDCEVEVFKNGYVTALNDIVLVFNDLIETVKSYRRENSE